MTAGEHSGRGHGPDDPRYPSSHAAYPAYPAYPASEPDYQGYPNQPDAGTGYAGQGYRESTGHSGQAYRPQAHGTPEYGGQGYGTPEYGGQAHGGEAYRPQAPGAPEYGGQGYGGQAHGGQGYGEAGYRGPAGPAPRYPSSGYQGGDGYPGNGRYVNGYQTNGYQHPGYDAAGAGAGYREAGYREPGYREIAPPDTAYRAAYPEVGYQDVGYATSELRAVAPRPEAYRPPPRGFSPDGRYQPDDSGSDPRRPPSGPAGAGPVRPGRSAQTTGGGRERRRRLPLWQELPLLLVIAFCLAILIRTFLLQAFYIPSGSMEDTLIAGDRVLVNKVVYNFREPARGEVVVFQGTDAWAPLATDDGDAGTFAKVGRTFGDLVGVSRPGEKDFIKRIIGVPGDVVSCCDVEGRIFVNGSPINESYVIRDSPLTDSPDGVRDCRGRQFDEVVVEPGQLFVLGDHRQRSQDSRCQGQVPIDNVIGRAFIIVWPNDRWAGLSATDAFASVPQPLAADVVPVDPGPPLAPAGQLALVLPLLLPIAPIVVRSARSRLTRQDSGRRLAA